MHPYLFIIPAWPLFLFGGALLAGFAALLFTERKGFLIAAAVAGAFAGLAVGAKQHALQAPYHAPSYGAMVMLGFLFGVWMAERRAKLIGITPEHCLDMGLTGILAGLAGARLFHVAENWEHYTPFGERGWVALVDVVKLWQGGLVFYGAFIAAIIAAIAYCRRAKLDVVQFLDLAGPSLIAGQAFGRLGCFLNGCCYGKVCSAPWAVHFPYGSDAYRVQAEGLEHLHSAVAVPGLHPTQLYAILGAVLTAGFLYAYWPRRRFDGQVFGLMLVMAAVTRFFEEFLRADNDAAFPSLSASLTIAQWIGGGIAAVGLAWLWYFRGRARRPRPGAPDGEATSPSAARSRS